MVGLLVVVVVAAPAGARPPRAVLIAVALLALYAAWSYLSIGWSAQQGMAWDGANRALLYALVFAVFAWRPLSAGVAGGLIAGLAAAIVVIGVVELVHLLHAAAPRSDFIGGRLSRPVGYPNADAVFWTMGLFVCGGLACARSVPSVARGLLAGGAVLLGGLALLAQSRGWLFVLPIGVLVFVALAPDPLRAVLAMAAIAAGVLAVRAPILDVHAALAPGGEFEAAVHSAVHAVLLAAAVTALAGFVAAELDRRAKLPWRGHARAGRVVLAAGVALAVLAAGAFALTAHDPGAKLRHAWHQFKGGQKQDTSASRFSSGLGSNRYDFWRVGVDAFKEHPIGGLGADTFQQYYLRHRRSSEQPLYPHSVEVRALSETGLVGALVLGLALVAAFVAAIGGGMRWRTRQGATAAAAATAGAAWWLLQGSLDWFWEFAGLGTLAFALLGLAAAVRPAPRELLPARIPLRVGAAVGAVLALGAAVSLALPWLAEREVQDAARAWTVRPRAAFDGLDRAASLNPLSSRPELIAGTIAMRLRDTGRARRAFTAALAREPGNPYAMLELGLADALAGDRASALGHLGAARRADPGDRIPELALRIVERGKRPDAAAINALIDSRARARLR
jgi:hypothetical protein